MEWDGVLIRTYDEGADGVPAALVCLQLFSRIQPVCEAVTYWCGEGRMARADCVAARGERRAVRKEGKRVERIAVHLPGMNAGPTKNEA